MGYDIIRAMVDARMQQNMPPKDLSVKIGIMQGDRRIENGTRNTKFEYFIVLSAKLK